MNTVGLRMGYEDNCNALVFSVRNWENNTTRILAGRTTRVCSHGGFLTSPFCTIFLTDLSPSEHVEVMEGRKQGAGGSPILVAMKGHPGTGKSTVASALARALRCPLIDKDDIRDCTYPIQQVLIQASPAEAAKQLLNDLSYEAMWQVAATQLRLGLSLVVDSPLSRRSHLNRLLEMGADNGAKVVVVECKPGDMAQWQRRVEMRGAVAGSGRAGWHKPWTWGEMEKLLESYGGCWDYEIVEVPRLLLDTTAPLEIEEMVSKALAFVRSCSVVND